jgi:hypothetical protein
MNRGRSAAADLQKALPASARDFLQQVGRAGLSVRARAAHDGAAAPSGVADERVLRALTALAGAVPMVALKRRRQTPDRD